VNRPHQIDAGICRDEECSCHDGALAAMLAFGVGSAVAAPLHQTPLTSVAAHDGLSVPSSLTSAITRKLGIAPQAAAPAASQPPAQQQELQAGGGMPLDLFGFTVSLTADGHTALVGAPGRTIGAAYVFVQRGGKWSEQQELDSPAGAVQVSYGWSVSLAGDGAEALVGAYSGNSLTGIVYSYTLNKGGSYVLDGQITPHEGQGAADAFSQPGSDQQTPVASGTTVPTSLFGLSVSIDALADRVLVGSPSANLGDGAAFVFDKGRSGWTQSQQLVQSNPSGADLFGYSVALDYLGDVALIGAPERNGTAGSAFTFAGSRQALSAARAVGANGGPGRPIRRLGGGQCARQRAADRRALPRQRRGSSVGDQ
jgi:hypothetical protein